ncbi:RRP6-like protein 3 isoform X1 [Tanacetum coccineum]|uniref:RRP6-like protein 3 isoform X1 n=1 Tax=Tanacetum coccineum TaxID=301880 RepID=A0ABQ5IRT4_9ASTR
MGEPVNVGKLGYHSQRCRFVSQLLHSLEGSMEAIDKIEVLKRSDLNSCCYLKTEEETKCQHKFKCVLANNSYAPFKHFKIRENSKDLHPYESEIKALLEKPQLDVKFSNGTMGDMKDAYVWVHDEEKLKQLVEISTRDEDYLVDTIALHDVMGILGPVFANPNICKVFLVKSEKSERLSEEAKRSALKRFDSKEARRFTRAIKSVFHGADNDVIWLQRDFHIYVVNLFDTAKACDVLSKPQRSLAYLLETYCGVITNKFYQREDWRQRPLPKDMLEYARMDVHYLLYIADCLVAELKLQKNVCTSNDLSKSENPASLDGNKFNFVYEASRRSNAVCLQLFTKELEASPGQSAAFSIISRHLNDPRSSTYNGQAAEHKESQQIEEYIGNGEKAADVNRDEDGSCLAGGAIRMDSEPSGQVKLNMAGQIKQMVSKNRCDMDAGHCPLQFSLKHRGPVNQMRPKKLAVNMMAALSPAFFEHGGPIKQLVLKTRCDMDGGIVPLRSVEHGGPIKQLVLKTRCDMDGGIVPLRSVEHGGPIKQLVLKTRCDMDGGIVPLRSVEHGGPIKQLVLKTRCDMDGGIVPLRSVEHGGPIKRCFKNSLNCPLAFLLELAGIIKSVLKTRCDMDGGIVPLCSVEHRGPIKQMVLKTRCDMDRGIVPLHSVEQRGPIKQMVVKSRRLQ